MRVHVICNGNAYRSRLAEACLTALDLGVEVMSSGVRADARRHQNAPRVTDYVNRVLARHELPLITHEPVQLTQEMLDRGDLLVAVNPVVIDNMRAAFRLPDGIRVWDISDFDEQTERTDVDEHTEHILAKIQRHAEALAAELRH
jgi:protein-tyrosine-phosphatase